MESVLSPLERSVKELLSRTSPASSQHKSHFHPHVAVYVQGHVAVNLENGLICTLDMSLASTSRAHVPEMGVCNKNCPYDEVFDLSFDGGGERLLVFGKLNGEFVVDLYFICEPVRIPLLHTVREYVLEEEKLEGGGFQQSSPFDMKSIRKSIDEEEDVYDEYSSQDDLMRPLQVSFHPRSSNHVLMLCSNNQFFMVHVCPFSMKVVVERSFIPIEPSGWRRGIRMFSFGACLDDSLECGWRGFFLDFTVFFLTDGGGIYCLCPVIPHEVYAHPLLSH
jgi:hypothetical protein